MKHLFFLSFLLCICTLSPAQGIDSFTQSDYTLSSASAGDFIFSPQDEEKDWARSGLYLGGGISVFNSFKIGSLLDFWQNLNGLPDEMIEQATGCFTITLGNIKTIDIFNKHWLGFEVQGIITPSHALWGTYLYSGGRNEVYYRAFMVNIALYYGYSLDDNGRFKIIFEPGLDIGTMTGALSTATSSYEQSFTVGLGGHIAAGLNFSVTPGISINARGGYRMMKIDEMHEDTGSETGFSSFYVNLTDGETVKADWSGAYMTLGINLAFAPKK